MTNEHTHSSQSETSQQADKFAKELISHYSGLLHYSAPERTIHELRESFLAGREGATLAEFTEGLRILLETRAIRRLNDQRLELTPAGREQLESTTN